MYRFCLSQLFKPSPITDIKRRWGKWYIQTIANCLSYTLHNLLYTVFCCLELLSTTPNSVANSNTTVLLALSLTGMREDKTWLELQSTIIASKGNRDSFWSTSLSYSSKDIHRFLRYLAYPYYTNRFFVYLFLFLPSIFDSFRDFKALSISKGVLD